MTMRLLIGLLFVCISGAPAAEQEVPELTINGIGPGIFLHRSFSHVSGWGVVSANGLVVTHEKHAFIIDTPWSEVDTQRLVDWIESKGYDLLGSVSTHSHEDRTAGIAWLNEQGTPTHATAMTNELLQQAQRETASHSLTGDGDRLADGLLEVFYPGGGHTIDNAVVWLPQSQILFGGCLVRSAASKNLGYTGEAQIEQWAATVAKVVARYPAVQTVVPGHGAVGDASLLTHTIQLAEAAVNQLSDQKSP